LDPNFGSLTQLLKLKKAFLSGTTILNNNIKRSLFRVSHS